MFRQSMFVAIVLVACAGFLRAEVRPLSDAEVAAVRIAEGYLSRGTSAVIDELASDSPLRPLPLPELSDEIEVRLGPAAGAQWELQTVVPALKDRLVAFTVTYPSGFEDHVIFDFAQEANGYKVREISFQAARAIDFTRAARRK